jgi:hypothetical protein
MTIGFLFHYYTATISDLLIVPPHGFLGSAGFLIKMLLVSGGMLLVIALAGSLVAFPASMLLAQRVLLIVWKFVSRMTVLDFGLLWFEHYSIQLR